MLVHKWSWIIEDEKEVKAKEPTNQQALLFSLVTQQSFIQFTTSKINNVHNLCAVQ